MFLQYIVRVDGRCRLGKSLRFLQQNILVFITVDIKVDYKAALGT